MKIIQEKTIVVVNNILGDLHNKNAGIYFLEVC